jgi:hypothetical protein
LLPVPAVGSDFFFISGVSVGGISRLPEHLLQALSPVQKLHQTHPAW